MAWPATGSPFPFNTGNKLPKQATITYSLYLRVPDAGASTDVGKKEKEEKCQPRGFSLSFVRDPRPFCFFFAFLESKRTCVFVFLPGPQKVSSPSGLFSGLFLSDTAELLPRSLQSSIRPARLWRTVVSLSGWSGKAGDIACGCTDSSVVAHVGPGCLWSYMIMAHETFIARTYVLHFIIIKCRTRCVWCVCV